MNNKYPWSGQTAPIFFASFVVCLYFFILFSVFVPDRKFFEDWQTLIAGLFAVVAAAMSVLAVHKQIAVAVEQEAGRIRAKNYARRAAASQPLSSLVGIQENVLDSFGPFLESQDNSAIFGTTFSLQEMRERDIDALIAMLEVAEPKAANDISELIGDIQIQQARLQPLEFRSSDTRGRSERLRHNIETYAVDAFLIWLRASRLLYYTRKQDKEYYDLTISDIVNNSGRIRASQWNISDAVANRIERRGKGVWLCARNA